MSQLRENSSLFAVRRNGRFGYINASGDIIVEIRYDNAIRFSDGLGCLIDGDLTHVVDQTGAILLSLKGVEPVGSFCSGYLVAVRGGKFGIFNKRGKVVVDFIFDLISTNIYKEIANAVLQNQFGLLHTSGDWVSKSEWGIISEWCHDSLITSVEESNSGAVRLIDKQGSYVSDRKFAQGWSESCGVLPVEFMASDGGGVGLVGTTGKTLVEGKYQRSNS